MTQLFIHDPEEVRAFVSFYNFFLDCFMRRTMAGITVDASLQT